MTTPNTSQPGFEPNFSCTYSVVLNHPIQSTFPVIGTSTGFERVTRLSGLCAECALHKNDTVPIPASVSLADTHFRTAPVNESAPSKDASDKRHLSRHFFTLTESVPVLFGLVNTKVSLEGTFTWDDDAKLALYESETTSGINIQVWKLRRFEALEGNKTKVTEVIHGKCPFWIKGMVEKECSAGHVAHMDLYHTLFHQA